jgi:hypothetical protein
MANETISTQEPGAPKTTVELTAEYYDAKEELQNVLDAHLAAIQGDNELAKSDALAALDTACKKVDIAADALNLF